MILIDMPFDNGGSIGEAYSYTTPPSGTLMLNARITDVSTTSSLGHLPIQFVNNSNRVAFDAFGRFRISNPVTIVDSRQFVDAQPLFWSDVEVSGTATSSSFSLDRASTSLHVSSSTFGVRVRQTRRMFNYQPGKSQLIYMTAVLGSGSDGITRRVGFFDEIDSSDGLFFEQSGSTGVNLVIRSSVSGTPVDTKIAQADWNLDTFDGNGPSGITLDLSKAQIFTIDFEWLGVGSVRFGFVVDGMLYYVHQANHANIIDSVYMKHPNHHLRYEISNDGTGPAATMETICSTVISEGGRDRSGISRSINRGASPLTGLDATALYPIIAIRQQATKEKATIIPENLQIVVTTAASFRWELIINPTVAGTALAYTALSNSSIEYDISTTNATTVSGGTVIASGYGLNSLSSISSPISDLFLGHDANHVPDVLVLAINRLTGNSSDNFFAALSFREEV